MMWWVQLPVFSILLSELAAADAESRASAPGPRLKLITGGDDVLSDIAREAIANQRAFAELHGFAHEVHPGNYARPWTAYWHKVHALLLELRRPQPPSDVTMGEEAPEAVVWFDLDLVVTDLQSTMLEEILAEYPKAAIILTEDPRGGGSLPTVGRARRLVNTGAVLARRGPVAELLLEKLFEYGRQHREAAFSTQDADTLHEQDAFNWLLGGPLGRLLGKHVAVIPQRQGDLNLNTFPRNAYDTSYEDPPGAEWMPGDFTAHCSGLRDQLREWCITDSVAAASDSLLGAASSADEQEDDDCQGAEMFGNHIVDCDEKAGSNKTVESTSGPTCIQEFHLQPVGPIAASF